MMFHESMFEQIFKGIKKITNEEKIFFVISTKTTNKYKTYKFIIYNRNQGLTRNFSEIE